MDATDPDEVIFRMRNSEAVMTSKTNLLLTTRKAALPLNQG